MRMADWLAKLDDILRLNERERLIGPGTRPGRGTSFPGPPGQGGLMARVRGLGLSAVRTEGAIPPPSLLQCVHREDASLGGMRPENYGLTDEPRRKTRCRLAS